jgi:prephenate dehydrogenase
MKSGRRVERVTIVGLGLMGGSLALALRRVRPRWSLVACDQPSVLEEARQRSLIDEAEADPKKAVRDADIVFLASPVETIAKQVETLASVFAKGSVVTDMGSTKRRIMKAAETLPEDVAFVGGHPMAGKASSGLDAADGHLFEGAAWALVAPDNNKDKNGSQPLETLKEIVRALGARPILVDAATHDRAVAVVSQLPQLIALVLCQQAGEVDHALELAGPAFRNLSRLASSSSPLWHDIFTSNSDMVREAIAEIERRLEQARTELGSTGLAPHFEAAMKALDGYPELQATQHRREPDRTRP